MPDNVDEKTTVLPPVTVALVGAGPVAKGPEPLRSGTVVETPGPAQPNLLVQVVSPLMAIAIRFANSYMTILVGLVAAGMTSDAIPSKDFIDLVIRCAGLSVAGAGIGTLKDFVTIFGRLESKYPLSTGNV